MREKRNRIRKGLVFGTFLVLAFVLASGLVSAASPHHDGWDVSGNPAGWHTNTAWTYFEVVDTGGNPGGYLYTRSDGSPGGSTYYAGIATSKEEFSDDFGFAPAIKISVDIKVLSTTEDLPNIWLRFRYLDARYNGWRYLLTDDPIFDEWVTYSVIFSPFWTDSEAEAAGWLQEDNSPSFSETLADVFTTEVRFRGTAEIYACIDNFKMEVSALPENINDYIQDLPDNAFNNNAEQKKNALNEILNEVNTNIDIGEYEDAIMMLEKCIRPKCDGSQGGNPKNDWIIDPDAQEYLCEMIDTLIAYLETLV